MQNTVFETLENLGLTSKDTRSIFNQKTRDVDGLTVWRDNISGVIYIEDYYTGDNTYIDGSYRDEEKFLEKAGNPDYERLTDAKRRLDSHLKHVAGKSVMDFGCGEGDFLRLIQDHCVDICGVELESRYVQGLEADGIDCYNDIETVKDHSMDVVVSFHVLEHLPNPMNLLSALKRKLKDGGTLIVEVPHANDLLLTSAANDEFKQFTLWSQHLMLHTRESLRRLLVSAGFNDVLINGVQRYPLSNHLNWLVNGKAGGHKSALASIDTPSLCEAYSNALFKIDATDTLVAIAKA